MLVLLSMGPKFALPIEKLPTLDLIADIEFIISRFADEHIKKGMRSHLTYEITKYAKSNRKLNRIEKFLLSAAKITYKFLKDNPNIYISTSDKGNITIVADISEYRDKMDSLLSDTDNFVELQSDPTASLEAKNNRLIRTLHNKSHTHITPEQAKHLKTYTSIPPRIFGQMKIHKPDQTIVLEFVCGRSCDGNTRDQSCHGA